MLYELFMLNMIWKSTERFQNLNIEILKWKMCRNPVIILSTMHCCLLKMCRTKSGIQDTFFLFFCFFVLETYEIAVSSKDPIMDGNNVQ